MVPSVFPVKDSDYHRATKKLYLVVRCKKISLPGKQLFLRTCPLRKAPDKPHLRVSQGGPSSLVPFQNFPMFPCSHTLSECFCIVIFRILFPCSKKLANVPLVPSIFCQCSLVPQNPWETLTFQSNPKSASLLLFIYFF